MESLEPKKKALIIDDDSALAGLLAEFCEDLGYEARCVTDSRSAVDEAVSWRPDLISLDLDMPEPDGLEILRRLRSHPTTSRIPIVVVSVLAEDLRGLRENIRARLAKPLRFAEFAGAVRGVASPEAS